jgi:hypothetical protein
MAWALRSIGVLSTRAVDSLPGDASIDADIGVSTIPGHIAFTRIPFLA